MIALAADMEGVVDGVVQTLLSPAFADALKKEWEGREVAVRLIYPEVVYDDEVETPSGYPAAEVIAVEERDNEQSGAEEVDNEVSVQWSIAGDNEQMMARQMKRYMRATRRVFRQQRMLPHVQGGPVRVGRVNYGLTSTLRNPTGQGRFVKTASITLFVQTFGR